MLYNRFLKISNQKKPEEFSPAALLCRLRHFQNLNPSRSISLPCQFCSINILRSKVDQIETEYFVDNHFLQFRIMSGLVFLSLLFSLVSVFFLVFLSLLFSLVSVFVLVFINLLFSLVSVFVLVFISLFFSLVSVLVFINLPLSLFPGLLFKSIT